MLAVRSSEVDVDLVVIWVTLTTRSDRKARRRRKFCGISFRGARMTWHVSVLTVQDPGLVINMDKGSLDASSKRGEP